jgi:hypothetical protein
LEDNDKPDIPIGTILETVDKLIEWKMVVFTVDDEEVKVPYHGNEESGQIVDIIHNGNTYSATIIDEEEEPYELNKHVCLKISDTIGSKRVYGVFLDWDNDLDYNMEIPWNDLYCASVGNYFIRIAAGQVVEPGDLIMSDGNGCGIVQEDDIIRSKTVGKVTTNIPQKVYDDGSFLVTAVLYCG